MSTMRDVGALAGVSAKTVSRVINGEEYVSADVRERVQNAITALGFVPNMLSQSFRNGRDSAIGVAVPDLSDGFFGSVIQSVERSARRRGTAVLVTSLGDDPATEAGTVSGLLRRQIAGLVIAPISTEHGYLAAWQPRTQIIFIDRPPHGLRADSVVEDDVAGARAGVQHLVDRGHRRIAFVGNAAAVVTTTRRLAGYREALHAARIPPDPSLELLYREDAGTAVPALEHVLAGADPVTAVFSSNSQSSVALMSELATRGRLDLPLVSFGDFPMAAVLRPPVTVLDQNPARVGEAAAERLFARIDGLSQRRSKHLVLPVPLLVRDSSGPVPSSQRPHSSGSPSSSSTPTRKRTT